MTDDAKRDGLIAFCEQGKDCEPATPWEEGYMAAMRVVVQHIKSAAPTSAQTPAGEALREAIEWAETVLCALQPTEQVRMRVLIAAALASQSSARPQEGADTAEDFCGVPHDYSHRETRAGTAYRIAAWTCPTCAKRCSCMVLDGEHCHGDSLCIRFVDGVRTVHCGACWIADSPSPAAKVADALAELSDEEIIAIRRQMPGYSGPRPWADTLVFARAVLAAAHRKGAA